LEAALQSPPTSQRIGISATRTGGHQIEIRSHILTLDVDTYVGPGQLPVHGDSVDWLPLCRKDVDWTIHRLAPVNSSL
jgi:hypothetical protein